MISALRDKYERIYELRVAHDRAANDASFSEADPRKAMASLADEFPGALRELDRLPLAQIEARLASLASAEEDPSCVEGWMIAQHTFHTYARGALATKRWLATNAPDEMEFRKALPALRAEAALFATTLEAVAFPERGRVMDLVYDRTAGDLGMTVRELRALLHG